ncbi:hypothetical protein OAT18_02430 [Tenacibaculum sp.]|nr:hypothetical protein [Tenacibaculum sp.]
MKNSILKLGKTLNKTELKSITGKGCYEWGDSTIEGRHTKGFVYNGRCSAPKNADD